MEALDLILKRDEISQKQKPSQKSVISSNKYVRSDLDELEKMCDGLKVEIKKQEDEAREKRLA